MGINAAIHYYNYQRGEIPINGTYGEIVGENSILSRKILADREYHIKFINEIFNPWMLVPFSSLWRREEPPSFEEIENQRPKDAGERKPEKDTLPALKGQRASLDFYLN